MYYLQSRYYDAEVGRFVNGDEISLVPIVNGIVNHNMFFYCSNSPTGFEDVSGYSASEIKSYVNETWIAWIMNKLSKKLSLNDRIDLTLFDNLGLKMQLFMKMAVADNRKTVITSSSFKSEFRNMSFSLGWGGKLDVTLGLKINKYTLSFMRGMDWSKSYISIYITYVTKNKRKEFGLGLYMSVTHLLKLAIAVTVVGACVLLPTLVPAFINAYNALNVKSKMLVTAIREVLTVLSTCTI